MLGSLGLFGASVLIFAALLLSSQLPLAQFSQYGNKLEGRISNEAVHSLDL